MPSGVHLSAESVSHFLVEDHRRLECLLQSALSVEGHVEQAVYDRFRAGLLRHIGMEEKILLPTVQRLSGGEPLPVWTKLRLDHGAIAALLMLPPAPAIVAILRRILEQHNLVEEGPDGAYEICDRVAKPEAEQLVNRLRAAPEVSVLPHSDAPAVRSAVHRALERAGYSLD